MKDGAARVRRITPDEAPSVAPFAADASRENVVRMVVERDGAMLGAGVLDSEQEPESAALRIVFVASGAELTTDIRPLIDALAEAAAAAGADSARIGWDPMDARGLRMLEAAGFTPTGAMPYFELGPGQVEYVTGYMDATGSTLDLVKCLR